MLFYHYTKNFRKTYLYENIERTAYYQKFEKWSHSNIEESDFKRETKTIYELYFGLAKNSKNVDLVLNGNIDSVVSEFIKKFQYPNPRETRNKAGIEFYKEEISNKQLLAPLRVLVKLLFYGYMYRDTKEFPYETLESYILTNEKIAKNNQTIESLYDEVLSGGSTRKLEGNPNITLSSTDRLIADLLQILIEFELISIKEIKKKKTIVFEYEKLSDTKKKYVLDIIEYDVFFKEKKVTTQKNSEEEYKKYMQSNEPLDNNSSYYDCETPAILGKKRVGVNKIYFGAPGTGKSFRIEKYIQNNGIKMYQESSGHPNVFRTTLHPEYSYNDFTGQVMPSIEKSENGKEKKITYNYYEQIFVKSMKRALAFPKEPIFLILEEMSRANVAAVFGDLFQLLDRSNSGESQYGIHNSLIADAIFKNPEKLIFIPKNLYILGTVNTSDQNVFVMDTAFKRRFEFEYVDALRFSFKDKEKKVPFNDFKFKLKLSKNRELNLTWIKLLKNLNEYIVRELELSEDKQIGQFFVKFTEKDDEYNYNQITGKLLQYLWMDVEAISFTDMKIFNHDIVSFGELYNLAIKKENFFSDEFLAKMK